MACMGMRLAQKIPSFNMFPEPQLMWWEALRPGTILHRMMSGRHWRSGTSGHWQRPLQQLTHINNQTIDIKHVLVMLLVFRKPPKAVTVLKQRSQAAGDTSQRSTAKTVHMLEASQRHCSTILASDSCTLHSLMPSCPCPGMWRAGHETTQVHCTLIPGPAPELAPPQKFPHVLCQHSSFGIDESRSCITKLLTT